MIKIKNYFNKQRLLLIFVVFLLYGNTLKNSYSLDDSIVTESTNITATGIKAIPTILRSYYLERAHDVKSEYRPLSKIAFAIEHELFGVYPGVSHAINLLLYILALFVLYEALLLLFSEYDKAIAFYCVLLFAVMPIHVEVVSSLKNREVLLSFIFSMIAFRHFLLFFTSDFKKWGSLIIASLCFYLSFFAKVDALPLIAIIPVLAYVKAVLRLKQALIILVVLAGLYLAFSYTKRGILGGDLTREVFYFENPLFFHHEFIYRIIATFNSLGFYINQDLFAFKQSCYYGFDTIPVLRLSWHGWLGILAAPLLIYGLVRSYRKRNLLLFSGLFIFCASVSMYLNLERPAMGIVADRFAFLSSLGAAISVVAMVHYYFQLTPILSRNMKIAALLTGIVFGTSIISRNHDWKTLDTLLQADQPKYLNSAFLNYRLGLSIVQGVEQKRTKISSAVQQRDLFMKAKNLVETSVKIDPSYVVSRSYLCYIYIYLLNDFNAALPHVNIGLSQEKNTELYFFKAICMRETGRTDSAEVYLKKCLELDPGYANAYNLLSYDYSQSKQYQKTIDLYSGALAKGINTLPVNNGLGKTYWEMGDTTHAIIYYQRALAIDPQNEEANAMVKRLQKN